MICVVRTLIDMNSEQKYNEVNFSSFRRVKISDVEGIIKKSNL